MATPRLKRQQPKARKLSVHQSRAVVDEIYTLRYVARRIRGIDVGLRLLETQPAASTPGVTDAIRVFRDDLGPTAAKIYEIAERLRALTPATNGRA